MVRLSDAIVKPRGRVFRLMLYEISIAIRVRRPGSPGASLARSWFPSGYFAA
jgi:hypothetical protein